MKRRSNPMKLAMEVCKIRGISANADKLSFIIHSIKEGEIAGVGITKDKDLAVEYIVFSDGSVVAGKDTLNDILSEDGCIESQDMFDSIDDMSRAYK